MVRNVLSEGDIKDLSGKWGDDLLATLNIGEMKESIENTTPSELREKLEEMITAFETEPSHRIPEVYPGVESVKFDYSRHSNVQGGFAWAARLNKNVIKCFELLYPQVRTLKNLLKLCVYTFTTLTAI